MPTHKYPDGTFGPVKLNGELINDDRSNYSRLSFPKRKIQNRVPSEIREILYTGKKGDIILPTWKRN